MMPFKWSCDWKCSGLTVPVNLLSSLHDSLWAPYKHITKKLCSAQKSLFSNLQLLWAATVHNKSQKVPFCWQSIRVFTEASTELGQHWPARAPECLHWSGSGAHPPCSSCQCHKSWCLQRHGKAGKQAVILPRAVSLFCNTLKVRGFLNQK